jgi:thermitase
MRIGSVNYLQLVVKGQNKSKQQVAQKQVTTRSRHHRNTPLLILCLATILFIVPAFPVLGQHFTKVENRILLKSASSASESEVAAWIHGQRGRQLRILPNVGVRVVELPPSQREEALRYFYRNPKVEFAEPDMVLPPSFEPNDPLFSYQWHLTNISCSSAWEMSIGSGVLVAVLDTGVESGHPDLVNRLVAGWNTYDDNADTSDIHGHGTAVIGTVGATANNSEGGASVAPGCTILPIRISDLQGYGYDSTVASGLIWAADHGARVANISYEFSGSATVATAANYFRSKGGVVIVAAGNGGQVLTNGNNPALITVSALRGDATLALWSNRGKIIDLAAPGAGIYTIAKGGGYDVVNGTSFAAPCVAGVAALVLSANPGLTASQAEDVLKKSANDLGTAGWDSLYGWGRVNAQKAVLLAQRTAVLSDTNAPTVALTSPIAGSEVSGTIEVQLNASDNLAVTSVTLQVDGQAVATNTTAPWDFKWNSKSVPDGTHTLSALAKDASGNLGVSLGTGLFVHNLKPDLQPPAPQVVSPANGAVVSGNVAIDITANDDTGVVRVDWYLNGNLMDSSATAPAVFTWKTRNYAAGAYQIMAQAYDAAGNKGTSPSVTVFIGSGDKSAPTVEITAPASGSTVAGIVNVGVSAADNVSVSKIEWYLDGTLKGSSQLVSPVFSWNTLEILDGSHILQARAYDAAGNYAISAEILTTVHNTVADITAPVVGIRSPASGATLGSMASVSVTAVDDTGITKLELYADGHRIASATNAPAVFKWLPKGLNCSHTLQAIAYDAAGNQGVSSPVLVYPEALAQPLMKD